MASSAEEFRQHVIDFGVIDPERVHHEFGQGLHGRKADFDKVPEDDLLFEEWVDLTTAFIREEYDSRPDALVGVANGTNRIAKPVAERLGDTIFLETEKQGRSNPVLTKEARLLVKEFKPVFALIIEDVGTVGTNALSAAQSALAAGVSRAAVLNALRRSHTLPLLDQAGIPHKSIVEYILPSYTAEECREEGLCAAGWELVPYDE